jgi:phosphoribosylamine--glycine ligase / phosphoribosylformylglycinamidine cyclo-ligase
MLFTGIMLTSKGPKDLEHSARFGDPETETMIPLLIDETDLAEILVACTNGTLDKVHIGIRDGFTCNVIDAAGGYPEKYRQGDVITFDKAPEGKPIVSSHDLCLL